jgi:flagellar hook protein FlgE
VDAQRRVDPLNSSAQRIGFDRIGGAAVPWAAFDVKWRMIGQAGYAEGFANGMEINRDGDVLISYSNDQVRKIRTIALAHFPSVVELKRIDNTLWLANQARGGSWIDFPQPSQYNPN